MILERARRKLRKNGYEPQDPVPSATTSIHGEEVWRDTSGTDGTDISFFYQGERVDGAFRVHGKRPDMPELDCWFSIFTRNLSEAIRISRIGTCNNVPRMV